MDASVISQFLHNLGMDKFIPLALALSTLASALDALIPQPRVGSHWVPIRKLLSLVAVNVHNATNAGQPTMLSWLQRIAGALAAAVPPPAQTQPTSTQVASATAPAAQFNQN